MRKIAIVGAAPYHEEIPDDYEVWVIALYEAIAPRRDRAFEVHEDRDNRHSYGQAYVDFLAAPTIPLYVPEHLAKVYPEAETIPTEYMAKKYKKAFGSTISYMIVQAIYEQVDEIKLFGIRMDIGTEYAFQRDSCVFWEGVAVGLGVKFSGLVVDQVYGLTGVYIDGEPQEFIILDPENKTFEVVKR